jgi:hypothetical protein
VSEFKLESTVDKASVIIPSVGPTSDLFSFCSKLSNAFVSSSGNQNNSLQQHSVSPKVIPQEYKQEDEEEEWQKDAFDDDDEDEDEDGNNQEMVHFHIHRFIKSF